VTLDVALVGTGGMMPLPKRWLSSVLLRYGAHLILFDCGEGTQISLRSLGWGLKDIDLILISHVHGDHTAGLPGLLLTQGNAGRTAPLDIVGPPGLGRVLEGLLVIAPVLPFAVRCREIADEACFEALDGLRVRTAAGQHHVPCLAYRLEVPRGRRFLPDEAKRLGVPVQAWKRLQRGERVGEVEPDQVLGPPRPGLAVGLVTDTRPLPALARLVEGVDLLVCEGTYGDDADQPRAVERRHMTFGEAATLAGQAGARKLLLTHFSPAVTDPPAYADSARRIFPETLVGHDHLSLHLAFRSDDSAE
jgi:ribonuclease Z